MKTKYILLMIVLFAVVHANAQNTFPSAGSAGIGTTTPNASSALEIKSTTQGMLVPRMTKAQRDAIVAPATGLLIYQTNSAPGFYYYNSTGWSVVSPKAGWSLTGNAGTDTAVNFIGTTDSMPLIFKVNNQRAGYIDYNELQANSAFGYNALSINSGQLNTADGFQSLASNTTGSQNTASGGYALYSNTTGSANTAIGDYALYWDTTGMQNTAIGIGALYDNTTGSNNTAIGISCLSQNTSGDNNTSVGSFALSASTTGNYNTGIGSSSLISNTRGYNNTASGYQSLYFNTMGNYNTSSGCSSLYLNTAGNYNTATGVSSLYNNTTGNNNTANGDSSLYSNNTGNNNAAFGVNALFKNTQGSHNTAIGNAALYYNSQNQNTAIGDSALYKNGLSGVQTGDGSANSALGAGALENNTTGKANTAIGYQSAYKNITGTHNTAVGYFGLHTNTNGSDNTTVGYSADVSTNALTNATAIGSGATVSLSNCAVLGNSAVTKMGVGVTPSSANIVQFAATTAKLTTGGVWTNASDKKLKDQFEKLDSKNILDQINQLDIERWHYKADSEKITHIGPVAQDFYKLFGAGDDTTISTIDPSGVALLGIQALSAQNQKLKDENNDLQQQLSDLKNLVLSLQQNFQQCNPCGNAVSSLQLSSVTLNNAASLAQNIPNPFNNTTTINYTLPSNYTSAKIIITDKNGSAIKTINISGSGKGSVKIDASTLASGAYQYSLYVNNKLIDTKQMMLGK